MSFFIRHRNRLYHQSISKPTFLHGRPWISPWIKSISNELDIIIHVIASQLSGYCDVINNRLWRHQQNVHLASEAQGRCVKIVVFIVIFVVVMSCKKYNNYFRSWRSVSALTRVLLWCLFPSLLRNSGNKHKNNPLVSAETVRHSSTYIILYVSNSMKYMEYRKILNACIKHAEESYYQQILTDRSNSAKNLWKHFGPILNSNKKRKCNISSLQVDGEKVNKDRAIADAFNDFFSNVGSNLDRKIGHQNTNFRQYLKNRISSSFFFAPILESDVRDEILKLKVNKASGPDDISPKVIRVCSNVWCNLCLYYTTHVSVRQLSLMTLKGLKSYHCISSWKRFLWITIGQ